MPSPFPGMNPYLEHPNIWHDFHGAFAFRLRDALSERLGAGYFVKVDENVFIHELSADERKLFGRPDVGIGHVGPRVTTGAGIGVLDAPSVVRHHLAVDELREPYLQIIDSKSRDIVTVIEILSPSNKGGDRDLYLAKRNRILRSHSHFVEFDLLRGGERMPEVASTPCDYSILVSRHSSRPEAGLWPLGLRDPFPSVPFPLRNEDVVWLEIKPLIESIYDVAKYRDEIYGDPIAPPLTPADAAWAAELLTAAGIPVPV